MATGLKSLISEEGLPAAPTATQGKVATNQNATATNQNATATNQNATATNLETNLGIMEAYPALAAKGVNYFPQFAAGAPINFSTAPTKVIPGRGVQIVLGVGAANPLDVALYGLAQDGSSISEVVTCAGPGTYQSTLAYFPFNRVQTLVDPGGTLDVQTNNRVAFGNNGLVAAIVSRDGVVDGTASIDLLNGSFVPTSAPDGSKHYAAYYVKAHNHTQSAHTHIQDAHTHTQNAHTHIQDSHIHNI